MMIFERMRREKQALQLKLKKKQDDQRKHMQAFVDRFSRLCQQSNASQSRLKALAKLQPIADIVEENSASFHFQKQKKFSTRHWFDLIMPRLAIRRASRF